MQFVRGIARIAATLICAASASAVIAGTPNTVAAGAVSYEINQGWVTHGVDESSQNRWFAFTESAGRSYCIEAVLGPATYFPLDPNLTLYTDLTGAVALASNDTSTSEPHQYKGARICYASSLATSPMGKTQRTFRVNVPIAAGSGDSGFVKVRVVETTLFATYYRVQSNGGIINPDTMFSLTNLTRTTGNVTFFLVNYGLARTFAVGPQSTTTSDLHSLMTIPGGTVGWSGVMYVLSDLPPGALDGWVQNTADNVQYHMLPK